MHTHTQVQGFPIRGFILIYKKNACFIQKSTENLNFFFFKWIKHIDLFQTMDKGGQNSCSL